VNNTTIIREATKHDAEQLLRLFEKHAEYEGHSFLSTKQAASDKLNMLKNLSDTPLILFVVAQGSEIKGYMSLLKQFSTWDMDYYLYMDCLYLLPELRGKGVGMLLREHCKSYAYQHNLQEIQWQTPVENIKAINFYKYLGATPKAKLRFFWE
jgi:GNAT superfamily N-acetyltransferase